MLLTSGKTPVVIYSNAPKVELYRDGVLIGTALRSTHTSAAGHSYYTYSVTSSDTGICEAVSASGAESLYITFNVAFTAGTISAKAYDAAGNDITASCGGTVSVTTPGAAAKLKISLDNALTYDGGLAYVEIDVTDADGNPVSTAVNEISAAVTGGRILAVDNGDQATVRKFQQSTVLTDAQHATIAAYAGKALLIVEGGLGTEISVTAEGLEGISGVIRESEPEDPALSAAVTVRSGLSGSDLSFSVVPVSGGGVYEKYRRVTVTAPETWSQSEGESGAFGGYRFTGWYVTDASGTPGGSPVSTSPVYCFLPEAGAEIHLIALYEPADGASCELAIAASAYSLSVNGADAEELSGEQTGSFPPGTVISVEYTGTDEFTGWKDGNGNVLSKKKSYRTVVLYDGKIESY